MLDAVRSRFRHYARRSVIGIGALVLAGGLIGCTEEEEVQYVYPSTTNPLEFGIWATGRRMNSTHDSERSLYRPISDGWVRRELNLFFSTPSPTR